ILLTEYLNGHSFALSAFTPAEYNPVSEELSVYQKITVKITTAADEKSQNALKNLKRSENIIKSVKKLDQNNGIDLDRYQISKTKEADDYDYLIITSDTFKGNFDALINFYYDRGLKTQVASTANIYSGTSGRDNPEKIRNYIIQEYQNNGIEFVLLAGDVAVVPHRGFFCSVQSSEVYTDDGIPADLYYSSLDGTWNDDDDNLWAEIGEDDLLPDISVARFSFESLMELNIMLNKTIKYQSEPVLGELRDPLLVGEFLWDDPETWGGDYLDLLIGFHDDNGYMTSGIPGNHDITKLYDKNGEWTKQELIAEINCGHSFIHHDGHSNYTYTMRMSNSDVTNANFYNVNGTDHNFTLIYTSGCMCGGFDYNDCIAEEFVSIENFAVSFIGNSRYGWFNEGQTEGPSTHIHREFADALYGNRTAKIGTAHKESKIDTAPWVTAPGQWEEGALRWCFYDCNVLGDPAMNIWTDEPENITVDHDGSITFGQSAYQIVVKGTYGQALSGINCVLMQNGIIFGRAETNSAGYAAVPVEAIYEIGEAELNISGYNTLLHNYAVNIVPNDGKYITIDSYRIDAGGDDLIEFGETVNISVTLKNVGLTGASGVLMEVTEDDDFIQLSGVPQEIGNINAGDTLRVENAFSFTVSESVPDQHEFTLNSKLYDTEEEWLGAIGLTANRPILEIINIGISDGNDNILDPGETGDLVISFNNSGHGKANNLTAFLSSEDPRITINSEEQLYNIINPSETIELIFNISAAEQKVNGYTSLFTCLINADSNFEFEDNFYVNIGSQIEDFETGDFSAFNWYFEGDQPWITDTSDAYQGIYSARSGAISHGQTSSILLNCDIINAGDVSFYVKTSSESVYDNLTFYIDDGQIQRWSGINTEWSLQTYPVSTGIHTFKWTYKKDPSVSAGEDCVRLDNINFPGMNDQSSVDSDSYLPATSFLYQNYPNPFNPETSISFALSEKGKVDLSVYNIKGEKVYNLVNDFKDKGRHSVIFNADNLNSGIYLYKLIFNDKAVAVKRMLLIK
ncbi:MAG: T9SS type A sorting domain-containing protein, partial [Candidatus Delongbacteria bacterium]|nr:T9SS type A sorting domain-containing protein [Candidatus Delongbacteria bacterium]MCG2760608.1 C25 family cysteine peptidase [Candidatus Delongbacteria bacterium]